jgi:hypothetical protein
MKNLASVEHDLDAVSIKYSSPTVESPKAEDSSRSVSMDPDT